MTTLSPVENDTYFPNSRSFGGLNSGGIVTSFESDVMPMTNEFLQSAVHLPNQIISRLPIPAASFDAIPITVNHSSVTNEIINERSENHAMNSIQPLFGGPQSSFVQNEVDRDRQRNPMQQETERLK